MSALDDLLAEVDELERAAADLARRSTDVRAKIRAYKASLLGKVSPPLVSDRGRLTEAGVRYCEAQFAAGVGPSEIARTLKVTVPAIVMRRQRWVADQKAAKRRDRAKAAAKPAAGASAAAKPKKRPKPAPTGKANGTAKSRSKSKGKG